VGRLDGRIALITGASSGLGEHFAELFVREGARVAIGARRVDKVRALAERLGEAALPVAIDVTDEDSILAAYHAAEHAFGVVDTVVANAGQSNPGRATDVPAAELRATVDVNFTGVFLTAREGARRLIAANARETGKGRIALIGSITAHQTATGDAAYAASKAAVAHLGRNLAREWVRAGVNVNVVQPGYIRTGINGDWFDTDGGARQIAGWHRRRLMPIDALDETLLYVCSDASAHVTGAVIDVDDGQSL
jgi:NAD(P)-dependent dehydrogenase (short-subunit alcohol dehydrogenase family)